MPETATQERQAAVADPGAAVTAEQRLRAHVETLERRLRKRDDQRRAMLHIMGDLSEFNKRLANQRKAMLHVLADYEQDRRRLARQTERLDSSRRALLHILQDSHQDKLRLEASRKAMIHIMGDLRETTAEMQRREQELRDKQEQLVQAGKLATLGELTTGVAHELNNPLNNIGLFVGNAIQLEQVFINLLTNARDAVAESPRKAVRIAGSARSGVVEVALADTGHGIPSGLEQRIFDPFFTTKEVGKGTGLGLSITYGIIKEHGGTISVVSPPGAGATFLKIGR